VQEEKNVNLNYLNFETIWYAIKITVNNEVINFFDFNFVKDRSSVDRLWLWRCLTNSLQVLLLG